MIKKSFHNLTAKACFLLLPASALVSAAPVLAMNLGVGPQVASRSTVSSTVAMTVAAVDAKVTAVEPSYMPGFVAFIIDRPAGACAAGSYLKWHGIGADDSEKKANVQAVYAGLITAMAGNRSVNLGVDESTCNVTVVILK